MRGDGILRTVAMLVLWLAPLPAAFFVGRSVYWHLIYNWHLQWGWFGAIAAIASGLMIEFIGILSAHVALGCARWNQRGDVRRKNGPREHAPFALSVACFATYAIVAICLAVVLEALPELSVYAPALITLMAADAYLSLGIYQQHQDRLARYRLQWDWEAKPQEKDEECVDIPMQTIASDAMQTQLDMSPKVQVMDVSVQHAQTIDTSAQVPTFRNKMDAVRYWHSEKPELTRAQLAERAHCDASTVTRALQGNGSGEN